MNATTRQAAFLAAAEGYTLKFVSPAELLRSPLRFEPCDLVVVPARPGSKWWRQLSAFPFCAIRGRLALPGHTTGAPFPSAVFFLGDDVPAFMRDFQHLGTIWAPYRSHPTQGVLL